MDKKPPVATIAESESVPAPKSEESSKRRKGGQVVTKVPKAVAKKGKKTGTSGSPRTAARPRRKTAKAINYAFNTFDDTSDFVAGVNVGPNSSMTTANDDVPHTSSVIAVDNIPHSSTTTITAENIASSAPTASTNEGPATVVTQSLLGKRKFAEISQDTPNASLRRESSPTVNSEGARAPKRAKSVNL
ncbi:unnamed protein product [Mucor hiemalis]